MRDAAEIETEIALAREDVVRELLALRARAARAADWRHWMDRRPWLLTGAAFVVGFWAGTRRKGD